MNNNNNNNSTSPVLAPFNSKMSPVAKKKRLSPKFTNKSRFQDSNFLGYLSKHKYLQSAFKGDSKEANNNPIIRFGGFNKRFNQSFTDVIAESVSTLACSLGNKKATDFKYFKNF